jgi:hypothetical protein
MIVFLSCLVGLLHRRIRKSPSRLLSRTNLVFQVLESSAVGLGANKRCRSLLGGGSQIIGMVLLAFDFVGGSSDGTRMSVRGALHDRI